MGLHKRFIILMFFASIICNCTDEDSVEQELAEQELIMYASGEEGEDSVDDDRD